MKCKIAVLLVLVCLAVCCMGQTFQYSRGWTNGKRANTHFLEDTMASELIDGNDIDKKLERCLYTLHRIIHNPYPVQLVMSNPKNGRPSSTHHHSNSESPDDGNLDTSDHFQHENTML